MVSWVCLTFVTSLTWFYLSDFDLMHIRYHHKNDFFFPSEYSSTSLNSVWRGSQPFYEPKYVNGKKDREVKFFHRFILPHRWRSRIFDQNISKFFFEKMHSLYKKCMRGLFLIVREYILRQKIMNMLPMLHLIRHWENVESMSLYWWSRYRYQRFSLHFILDINKN